MSTYRYDREAGEVIEVERSAESAAQEALSRARTANTHRRAGQYERVIYSQGPPEPGQPDVFNHRTPEGFAVITCKKDVQDAVDRSGGNLVYDPNY